MNFLFDRLPERVGPPAVGGWLLVNAALAVLVQYYPRAGMIQAIVAALAAVYLFFSPKADEVLTRLMNLLAGLPLATAAGLTLSYTFRQLDLGLEVLAIASFLVAILVALEASRHWKTLGQSKAGLGLLLVSVIVLMPLVAVQVLFGIRTGITPLILFMGLTLAGLVLLLPGKTSPAEAEPTETSAPAPRLVQPNTAPAEEE